MPTQADLIQDLTTLNEIAQTLNRAADVRSALDTALAHLVKLMGLETGWIFLAEPANQERWWGKGYVLAAHHNLPPALALDQPDAWDGGCDCQGLCTKGKLAIAYNEVRCSRLAAVKGDRRGLTVHASAPLCVGERVLGILNVAGRDWDAFSPRALALLSNVGSLVGIALERARLFDLLQERRIHEQAVLLELSNQLLSRHDLDDLIHYLINEIRRLLPVDACTLLLMEDDDSSLCFCWAAGWQTDPLKRLYPIPAGADNDPGLVMQTQRPLLVEDLQERPGSWLPDWARTEGFRGQALVPLLADGRSIGVLVINSRQPRFWPPDEVRLLQLMANQAALAIERAQLRQVELRRQRLEEELAVGRQIQLSLLPDSCPVVPGWDLAATYRPARQVGGDFYDFFELPDPPGRLGLVVADVADKGVPAALFMALSRTMIRASALGDRPPAAVLQRVNEFIFKDSQAALFLTAFYAILDTQSGRLTFCNAGHNRPLWAQAATGEVRTITTPGIALGVIPVIRLSESQIDLAPGDLLVLYTDGVTEAMDANWQEFGESRLREVVASQAGGAAGDLLHAILGAVSAFTGDTAPADDLTLFIVKRNNNEFRD